MYAVDILFDDIPFCNTRPRRWRERYSGERMENLI